MQRSCWWSPSPLRRAQRHKWLWHDNSVSLDVNHKHRQRGCFGKCVKGPQLTHYSKKKLEPGCSAFGLWFCSEWDQALMFGRRGWAHIQLYSSGFDGWGLQALCRSVLPKQVKKMELCLASCMLYADTTCKQLPQITRRFNEPTDWRLCFVDSIKKKIIKSFKGFYI